MRTIPNIEPLLSPLEEAIVKHLIPALSGGRNPTANERAILELPPRLGGLGITNPCKIADMEFQNSVKLSASLTQAIITQETYTQPDTTQQKTIKMEITKNRETKQRAQLQELTSIITEDMKRRMSIARETGVSNWLTSLPIKVKGFSLNKQEFVDALALRYGWPIEDLHQHCTCGSAFDPNHAMTCKTGGFVCMRHDEVRDVTAQMLGEVCRDVRIEPPLIPTEGRNFSLQSANTADDARLDISANSFWIRGQRAFFDIQIFNPMVTSNRSQELLSAHTKHENNKMREYGERVREVEQEKRQQQKSAVVAWMRCRLAFSLLRSSQLCLRGTRNKPAMYTSLKDLDIEETVVNSRIERNM
ncbi:uncharacterized protein LOC125033589 [Penaeus chinensis]|uniref:uncharacterized protein LOC125033589 n=1 Tax=Penaeus chinensis TaxID=139456 RepID=UPI001FB75A02|nr:uncharacterized protein LOC125033589 [Penaeus chinensis]